MKTPLLILTVSLVAGTGGVLAGQAFDANATVKNFSRLLRRETETSEVLEVFPVIAYPDGSGGFNMDYHSVGFTLKDTVVREGAFKLFLKTLAKGNPGIDEPNEQKNLDDRIAPFISKPVRGVHVSITTSKDTTGADAGESGSDGHLESTLPLLGVRAGETIDITSVTADGNADKVSTAIVADDEGFGVISDIDDTIKITDVLDNGKLAAKTFFEEFQPVDTMTNLYAFLKKNLNDPVIYYLSASPFQLITPIKAFLAANFPTGELILKKFDLSFRDISSVLEITDVVDHKVTNGRKIFKKFPSRKFLLIGDSGQSDPEIYGQLFRETPDSVRCILIRMVTGVNAEEEAVKNAPGRFDAAFQGVPPERIFLFNKGSDLADRVDFKTECQPLKPVDGPKSRLVDIINQGSRRPVVAAN